MEKDLMKELSAAINDAVSSVLKARNIPHAAMQGKVTIDGGSDWMTFGGPISGTECLGGGGGGSSSGATGAFGGKSD